VALQHIVDLRGVGHQIGKLLLGDLLEGVLRRGEDRHLPILDLLGQAGQVEQPEHRAEVAGRQRVLRSLEPAVTRGRARARHV
jgi:hypothetical protein